ncbi:Ig-like domain-containing protein [Caballeronia sordidicola]|uniref:Ig-like domain-containing protein n=1 Tax=Caballeronia sordidicola TaxID=196367 RepID=UPI00126A2B24|nr:Ig-like domain-containing protein [Caballeronia sordidicola]
MSTNVLASNAPATPNMLGLIDHTFSNYVDFGYGATLHDSSPGIVFTTVIGNTYSLYDNGTLIGTMVATNSNSTNWTVPSTLQIGAHVLTVTATDAAGNTSAPSGIDFTLAAPLPATPVIVGMIDHSLNVVELTSTLHDSTPEICFWSVPGNTYSFYDNGALIGTMVATKTSTNWTVPALKNGAHALTVTATDAAGHTSAPAEMAFTVAVPLPATPETLGLIDHSFSNYVDFGYGATLHDSTPAFAFRAVPGTTYSLYDNGALIGTMVATKAVTAWTVPVALKNGAHVLTVTAADAAGNTSAAASIDFKVAVSLPAAPNTLGLIDHSISNYADFGYGATLHDSTPAFVFSSVAGNTYSLYDNGALIGTMVATKAVTAWTVPEALQNGAHVLTVMASDAAGNTSAAAGIDFTVAVSSQSASDASTHFAVGLNDAFVATGDHQTADLSFDPAAYFKQSTAHIAGGDTGVHTLHLTGSHEVLDLTSLTGKTATAKISGVEVIDLGGHSNSLNLSLLDVLNLGQTNLFQNDGNKQMVVNGSNGDTVDLLHAKVAGIADTDWQTHGTAAVGGVTYNVYEHAGAHTELLIQQSVQVVVH